jgi:2-phosphosulfolactate phosphatase
MQADYTVRFEWGEHGARALAATSDVVVIVDVLSFSTTVDVAAARGAEVLPFASRDVAAAAAFAGAQGALLAVSRQQVTAAQPYSLSPASVRDIPETTRLVLPSPNGSTLTLIAAKAGCTVFAGCLRNASAVAAAVARLGGTVGVVAAGERWPDRSLRPAIEDLLGAGAIISELSATNRSPEAEVAVAAFTSARADLQRYLRECISGRELIDLGYPDDVELAAELNSSSTSPILRGGAYSRIA